MLQRNTKIRRKHLVPIVPDIQLIIPARATSRAAIKPIPVRDRRNKWTRAPTLSTVMEISGPFKPQFRGCKSSMAVIQYTLMPHYTVGTANGYLNL